MHRLRLSARVLGQSQTGTVFLRFLFASDFVPACTFSLFPIFGLCATYVRSKKGWEGKEKKRKEKKKWKEVHVSSANMYQRKLYFLSLSLSFPSVSVSFSFVGEFLLPLPPSLPSRSRVATNALVQQCTYDVRRHTLMPSCISIWYTCYTLGTTPVNVLSKVWIMRSER